MATKRTLLTLSLDHPADYTEDQVFTAISGILSAVEIAQDSLDIDPKFVVEPHTVHFLGQAPRAISPDPVQRLKWALEENLGSKAAEQLMSDLIDKYGHLPITP